jgi:hypothetical protein
VIATETTSRQDQNTNAYPSYLQDNVDINTTQDNIVLNREYEIISSHSQVNESEKEEEEKKRSKKEEKKNY